MKNRFDSRRFYLAIKKNKYIILIIVLISFGIGVLLNYKAKPNEYRACATVYSDMFSSYLKISENEYINTTYVDIVKSKNIAKKAKSFMDEDIDELEIKNAVTCSYSKESPVYCIYATTKDPELSVAIADAVAKAFVIELNTIKKDSNSKVLDDAYEYEKVFDGRKEQIGNIVVITIIGVFVSLISTLMISLFSNKIETVNDVTLNGKIEILGVIPNFDVE